MKADSDMRFVFAMLASFEIEERAFDDAVVYIEKLQKIIKDKAHPHEQVDEMVNNLLTWANSHKLNMRNTIEELNKIKSTAYVTEIHRPAILDVCSIRSGFIPDRHYHENIENEPQQATGYGEWEEK